MTGIEARLSRPPHPHTQSRETASSPRKEISPLRIFEATEKFRTGQEALFGAVRSELTQTIHYAPRPQLPQDPDQTITVAIASNNDIKVGRMQELVSTYHVDVLRIPEAEEWHTKDVIVDATSKAVDAARVLQESEEDTRRDVRNRPYVTMATDQLNAIPVIVEDPLTHESTIRFERLGKPMNEDGDPVENIKKTLQELAALAVVHDWKSVPYIIELATVIHNPKDPDNDAVSVQKSTAFLSRESLISLATDRFDEYITNVGKTFDISKIAGGLELRVMEEMGLIEFVTGTPREITPTGFPPKQREDAQKHAYALALGHADEYLVGDYFSPEEQAIPIPLWQAAW